MWDIIKKAVNTNVSKPLNTLITEVSNNLVNMINALPQRNVYTDVRGSKLDNLDQSVVHTQNVIVNATNEARDNINSTTINKGNEIKAHVTDAVSRAGTIKSIQRGAIWNDTADRQGAFQQYFREYRIGTVNPNKCVIQLFNTSEKTNTDRREFLAQSARLFNANTLQIDASMYDYDSSLSERNRVYKTEWVVIEYY